MRKYVHQGRNLKITNRGYMIVIALLCLVVMVMSVGMYGLTRTITVYIPPDTSGGATVIADTPGAADVFGFANYITQYVNHWPNDGEKDYPQRIFDVTHYITPAFKADLEKDVKHSQDNNGINELKNRVRQLEQDPEHLFKRDFVKILSDDVWQVDLKYRLVEHVGPLEVKNVLINIPMRVVKVNIDREKNQWGLQLGGYAGKITRIDDPDQYLIGQSNATNGG